MAKRWYVVHVYSGFEKKVAVSIREQAEQKGLGEKFVAVGGFETLQSQTIFRRGLLVAFFGEVIVPQFAMGQIIALTLHQMTEFGCVRVGHLDGWLAVPAPDKKRGGGNDESPEQKTFRPDLRAKPAPLRSSRRSRVTDRRSAAAVQRKG